MLEVHEAEGSVQSDPDYDGAGARVKGALSSFVFDLHHMIPTIVYIASSTSPMTLHLPNADDTIATLPYSPMPSRVL